MKSYNRKKIQGPFIKFLGIHKFYGGIHNLDLGHAMSSMMAWWSSSVKGCHSESPVTLVKTSNSETFFSIETSFTSSAGS